MSNNKYIDNRSYEEHVIEAKPTGAYNYKVRDILLDERSHWQNKNYTQKWEGYSRACQEHELNKQKNDLKSFKEKVDNCRNKIDEFNEKLKESKMTEIEKNKINKLIETQSKMIEDYIDEINTLEQSVKINQQKLDHDLYMDWISRCEYYNLGRASREYRQNHDLEYLCKAVHYICSYADKLRYGSKYCAPYFQHPLEMDNSPFSYEVTARMNHVVHIEPEKMLDLDNW